MEESRDEAVVGLVRNDKSLSGDHSVLYFGLFPPSCVGVLILTSL